ncbi:MAG: Membrane-bound metal-dependent hydrolase YdjM, induced during SOS response, partial [uncultured Rubrobacteraceae bacterium]
ERDHTRGFRRRGAGGRGPPDGGRPAGLPLPRGRRGGLAAGRGQPAQHFGQRPEPLQEPRPERPEPAVELGPADGLVRARADGRAPDAYALHPRGPALRPARLPLSGGLPEPLARPRRGLRFPRLRRRAQHPRRAAALAGGPAVPAAARGHKVGWGGGGGGSFGGADGGALRHPAAQPLATRPPRPPL